MFLRRPLRDVLPVHASVQVLGRAPQRRSPCVQVQVSNAEPLPTVMAVPQRLHPASADVSGGADHEAGHLRMDAIGCELSACRWTAVESSGRAGDRQRRRMQRGHGRAAWTSSADVPGGADHEGGHLRMVADGCELSACRRRRLWPSQGNPSHSSTRHEEGGSRRW